VTDSYQLLRTSSSASDFHQRQIVEPVQPQIWWHEVTRPALVLGSTQHREVVDYEACAANEVEVVRRRSGGGAVLLIPGDVTWVDVVLPAGAPGWASDVHAPMVWLGRILADALSDLLPGTDQDHEITVHDGKIVTTKWSPLVCFDGIGAGEVLLGENKLIGISQRRTRTSARLQCCWYSSYDPKSLVSLLLPGRRPPISDLRSVATLARSVASRIPETLLARLNQQR
jgi:lipoate-protein ligase A